MNPPRLVRILPIMPVETDSAVSGMEACRE